MQRILRWEVPVDDEPHLIGAGPVVHIDSRRDRFPRGDRVEVWTLSSQACPEPSRRVQVVGTAHPFPIDWTPLGSVVALDGLLVWHLCEVPS